MVGSDRMTGLLQKTKALINDGTSKKPLENNNSLSEERNNEIKMVTCPVCGSRMREEGKVRTYDFLKNKEKYVTVYYCGKCGYRSRWL